MLTLAFSMPPTSLETVHGYCWLAFHATPILKKAAWVTAWVSAVILSCSLAERYTFLDLNSRKMLLTNVNDSSDALCWIKTKG